MKTLHYDSSDTKLIQNPVVLTIGMFDGVHLGHQAVLNRLREIAKKNGSKSAVFTFENHPAEVLRTDKKACLLCSLEKKKVLFENLGIDFLVLAQFTSEFSHQSAEEFLLKLRKQIPFTHLILGHDATIGKDRQGDKEIVQELAKKHQFEVEYIEPLYVDGVLVSSSKIRHLLQQGNFADADKLLGRRFSIMGQVIKGLGLGKKMGYPTANIGVKGLCLPPLGIYAVTLIFEGKAMPGAANLGYAPTVRNDKEPILEVHLLEGHPELYGKTVEVVFEKFLRPEKHFDNMDELKTQIGKDIEEIKKLLMISNSGSS